MARLLITLVGVFLLPFLAYVAFLVLYRRDPQAMRAALRKRAILIQALVGLALMALTLIAFAVLDERKQGGYRPAEFRDGTFIPGRVE